MAKTCMLLWDQSKRTKIFQGKDLDFTAGMYIVLTKLVRSRWLDIGLVLFLRFYGPRRSRGP